MPKEEALKLERWPYSVKNTGISCGMIIDPAWSVELCGGTHVGPPGSWPVQDQHESAVAAGVRRIEAVSGKAAEIYISEQLAQIRTVREDPEESKELKVPSKAW